MSKPVSRRAWWTLNQLVELEGQDESLPATGNRAEFAGEANQSFTASTLGLSSPTTDVVPLCLTSMNGTPGQAEVEHRESGSD
jgi:hypothetical protein